MVDVAKSSRNCAVEQSSFRVPNIVLYCQYTVMIEGYDELRKFRDSVS